MTPAWSVASGASVSVKVRGSALFRPGPVLRPVPAWGMPIATEWLGTTRSWQFTTINVAN
jgi:hypothetical protein